LIENGTEIGGGEEDDEVDEDQLYDLEDKKVLNKRKKRTAKVEDCNQALEQFIVQKKRQKVTEILTGISDEDTSIEAEK
jgi:hypothetical protein